jgi:NAD kinase
MYYHKEEARKTIFSNFEEHRKHALISAHKKQERFEEQLKSICKELSLQVTYIREDEVEEYTTTSYDLVMTCGGDGTFLNAAQLFDKQPLIGLNSDFHDDPAKGSIGGLTILNHTNLEEGLTKIKNKEYHIEQWKRLYITINGKRMPDLAVNDIYVGSPLAYATSHFEVFWDGQIEQFKGCSGMLATTGMGSNSWFKHAQGTPFANKLPIFGFLIRDPNVDRHSRFTKGIVPEGKELIIKPHRSDYVVSIDSKPHNYELHETDVLGIGLSDKEALEVIKF